ncbi:MAG: tetratricopeptide repeat protein [Planctomycetota bacterium]
MKLPSSLARLALEVEGWLELGCAEHALSKMPRLDASPEARPIALALRVRALVNLERFPQALTHLDELRRFDHDADWADTTEAWCRKRLADLPGAIACMERLLARTPRSALGHYNLGCYLALAGDTERALDEVSLACGMDEAFRKHAVAETDLDALRGDPQFEALLPGGAVEDDD